MKSKTSIFIFFLIFGYLTTIPNQSIYAQSGIQCVWCGGLNGNHNPGCKYLGHSSVSKPSSTSLSLENEIMGIIFSNFLKSGVNSKQTGTDKAKQEQEKQVKQQKLAVMLALQKKYNDSIAQVSHDKMMKEYKQLGDGSELTYKGLDERKWKASVNFNCKITSFKGDVSVVKADGKFIKLTPDQTVDLAPGDWLATGADGRVKLHYGFENGGEDITLGQKSVINIVTDEYGTHIPSILRGNIYVTNNIVTERIAEIKEDVTTELIKRKNIIQKKINPIRIPGGTCSIRGTEFTVEVDSTKSSAIYVFDGIVEITDNEQVYKLILTGGQKGKVNNAGIMYGSSPIGEEETAIRWWEKD